MPKRVFITAAEVSGDRHAAQLIAALRRLDPSVVVEGLGGPEMAAAGARIHHETVGNAAMGWRGALRAVEVYRLLKWTKSHFDRERPDVQIGVDSPSMNFHFAKVAKERGIPVMQYVAPQLWAWREGRMKKLRKRVDHVACVLPFEEEYFRSHGVRATFVGHPLFDELPANRRPAPGARFRDRAPVIGLLPGSRKSEAAHNFPRLLSVAQAVRGQFPNASFFVPTTPATDPVVREWLGRPQGAGLPVERALDRFDEMVPRCDLCLTVSGTATLHVASFGVPMIVVYAGNPVLWNAIGRWLVKTRTYSLVNLLAAGDKPPRDTTAADHIVPEFIPWYGSTEPVARLALEYLRHPARLAEQSQKLRQLVQSLDRPGASENVARVALDLIGQDTNVVRPVATP